MLLLLVIIFIYTSILFGVAARLLHESISQSGIICQQVHHLATWPFLNPITTSRIFPFRSYSFQLSFVMWLHCDLMTYPNESKPAPRRSSFWCFQQRKLRPCFRPFIAPTAILAYDRYVPICYQDPQKASQGDSTATLRNWNSAGDVRHRRKEYRNV